MKSLVKATVGTTADQRTPATDPPSTTEQLLRARDLLPGGDPRRAALRTQAIVGMLPLANRLARRYAGRGERLDDLVQVAAMALVKAVDGYDPQRLAAFISYAVPTIDGALKRHFRDTAWDMRVPRGTQQLTYDLRTATSDLEQLRGRTPTSAELATHLGVTVGKLTDAVNASHMYQLRSLDSSRTGDADAEPVNVIGVTDPRFADVDERLSHRTLGRLVTALPPRERRILAMRFSDEMTQASIASELGISQMHVSRLLNWSLRQLRDGIPAQDVAKRAPVAVRP
jgi:RNA polymerase sigma-B factor